MKENGRALYFKDGQIKKHIKTHKTVYHYTSPEGIYSILNKDKLWFTDCQYLNDKSEYMYIKKPLFKAFELMKEEAPQLFINSALFSEPYQTRYVEIIKDKGKKFKIELKRNRFFVFCTSKNPDTQNMWNYYVKNDQYLGYNLGIDVDMLVEHLSTLPQVTITHGEVLYDEDMQAKQIKNFIERLNKEIEPMKKRYEKANEQGLDDQTLYQIENSYIEHYQESLVEYIDERRLFFKHKAFESEREYRFVVKVPDDFNDSAFGLDHRVGTNGIIMPYRELLIDKKKNFINQITLSPMLEIELAQSGLESLLEKEDLKDIKIVNSDIEIRY